MEAPLIQSVKVKCQILNEKVPMTSIASALVSNCRQFCSSSELSDVTFVVGKGKNKAEFPAIRLWFAMHSRYFKKLFTDSEPVDRIEETDVTALAFEYIYKYFYLQQPSLTADNVVDVLYAANKYELETVVAECDAFIDGTVKENNIVNILLFESRAIALGLSIEHSVRVRFKKWLTVETSLQIIETKAYLNTSQELLVYLIKHDSFSVQEKDVWIACEAWCNHQIQLISQKMGVCTCIDDCDYKEGCIISETTVTTTLKQWMSPFIPHIRFTLMENSFFVQNVYKSKILEMEHAMNISLYLMDPTVEINATYIKNITQRHKVVYYHTHNMKVDRESNVLQFSLEMSSSRTETKCPYEYLTNNNIMLEMSTKGGTNNEFIMAKFEKKKFISRMDISPGMTYCECKEEFVFDSTSKVQWKNDSNNWIDWSSLTDLKMTCDGKIKTIYDMNIHTTAIRILDDSKKNVSLGCWRLYGFDSLK
eukprot:326837_1